SATITLTGTSFVSGSIAKSNGVALTGTWQSATQMQATIPSGQLGTLGALAITVTNAAPGGGTSSAKTIQVGCDTTGVDYPLAALNAQQTVTLSLSSS